MKNCLLRRKFRFRSMHRARISARKFLELTIASYWWPWSHSICVNDAFIIAMIQRKEGTMLSMMMAIGYGEPALGMQMRFFTLPPHILLGLLECPPHSMSQSTRLSFSSTTKYAEGTLCCYFCARFVGTPWGTIGARTGFYSQKQSQTPPQSRTRLRLHKAVVSVAACSHVRHL